MKLSLQYVYPETGSHREGHLVGGNDKCVDLEEKLKKLWGIWFDPRRLIIPQLKK